jgi:hypothetical protein
LTTDEMKILLDLQKQVSSIDGRTAQILEQTKKTNGHVADLQHRVTTIETKMAAEQAASAGEGKVKSNIGSKVWAVTERAIGVILGIAIGKVMK